jgi:uncharacterized membrane protein
MGLILFLQEQGAGIVRAPHETSIEVSVANAVQWLRLAVEASGAIIIGLGVVIAMYLFVRGLIPPRIDGFNDIRLTLARFLALALEFQLGADILSTAVAPSWDQIGKLGAIAVIRTGLNYFLTREMRDERSSSAVGIGKVPDTPVP